MTQHVNLQLKPMPSIAAVDLFCGIGGLTHGFIAEGIDVVAGVDNDASCKIAYEKNNCRARFITSDIARFSPKQLDALFDGASIRVLVGCAPCQPYSSLAKKKSSRQQVKRWYPLFRFMHLIRATRPEIVSIENVPDLARDGKYPVFSRFIEMLKADGYYVSYSVINAADYGVPQRRNRLVLLASRFGAICIVPGSHNAKTAMTVRDAIYHLPALKDGEIDKLDSLHRSSKLSALNKERVAATPKNGGSATSWPNKLMPPCYLKASGKSYMVSVYGRMRWDQPAPTITTQCTTLGTGRFGHPEQDRAISLREAARFQSFPDEYDFGPDHGMKVARHIGNAVPVELAKAIARSILYHIATHNCSSLYVADQ